MTRPRIEIGKLPVDVVTFREAIAAIEDLVDAEQGGAVFTPNVDHLVMADSNAEFVEAYSRADLSLADGMPVVWASRLLGAPLPERVSGADILWPLLERAAARQWRVYLCGAGPGVAAKAATTIQDRLGVNIVGTDGPMVDVSNEKQLMAIAEQICAAKPHVVLMAFGAPKQELLIHHIRDRISPAVALGIGAGLDFIAGTVKRAPVFMQRSGFEWLYRLMSEPKRLWRRYLVNDPQFALIVLNDLKRRRAQRKQA